MEYKELQKEKEELLKKLVEGPIPKIERMQNKCKNCAYYNYCWV